jgi:hypothetical protein
MSLSQLRRLLLIFFGLFFLAFGLAGLFAPAMLAAQLHLMPLTNAGLGELRALYGGGFAAIGFTIFAGLRCKVNGPGLLLAMSILLAGIAAGRVVSLIADHDVGFAAPNGLFEFLLAAACYSESRRERTTP